MGVEAAESMSMNRVSGVGPVYRELNDQSPCDRSYTATLENEFHLLKSTTSFSCPLVLLTSNGADPSSCRPPGTPTTRPASMAVRAAAFLVENNSAAIPPSSDASRTTPGA